jgi:hypothetical protein
LFDRLLTSLPKVMMIAKRGVLLWPVAAILIVAALVARAICPANAIGGMLRIRERL